MSLPIEPFKIEKEWIHAGLKCAVVQTREAGHRCGYVRVSPNHSTYKKHYDELEIEVHGGLTFGKIESCVEEDGQGFWFGFDCAHCDDMSIDPNINPLLIEDNQRLESWLREIKFIKTYPGNLTYWNYDMVVSETEKLAEQLAVL